MNQINEITILPDKTSIPRNNVKTIFYAERNIESVGNKYNLNSNEIDTHMMKNIEWGAVAYLTQSIYGIYKDENTCNIVGMTKEDCEVWINNTAQGGGISGVLYAYGGTYTGCVGESVSAAVKWNVDDNSPAKCDVDKVWNTTNGVKASTTGNMYGIYDMNGGGAEYVMGAIVNKTGGGLYTGSLANVLLESKYYDMYTFSEDYLNHARGHLGDATREILQIFGNSPGGWNRDYSNFPNVTSSAVSPWFRRGGEHCVSTLSGVFGFSTIGDGPFQDLTFRSVLSAA